MSVRITQAKVMIVSDYAKEVSGNRFGLLGIGGDIGHGARYIDGRKQKVWLGPKGGARKAASYYLGVIDAFNRGAIGNLPENVNAVRAELITGAGFSQREYDEGASEANSFIHRA